MPLQVVFGALAPEAIIYPLLLGDGAATTRLTALTYEGIATQLDAAAANTDGSMTQMGGGPWTGLSSDQAQAAFHNHANWMREQAMVARQTAELANAAATIFNQAQGAMQAVATWCAKVRAQEALAPATGIGAGLALLEAEAELLMVRGPRSV